MTVNKALAFVSGVLAIIGVTGLYLNSLELAGTAFAGILSINFRAWRSGAL